jgi:hypothetical protein
VVQTNEPPDTRTAAPHIATTHPDGAGHAHHDHTHPSHGHGEERLREVLRERLVDIRSMSIEAKVYTTLAGITLLTLAVLSLLRNDVLGNLVTSPQFSAEPDGSASMSQIAFIACVVAVCIGWALVVTAATRAGWIVRVATIAALAIAFGTERLAVTDINLGTTLTAAGMCAVLVLLLVLTWFAEFGTRRRAPERPLPDSWRVLRTLVFPLSFLIFLGLYGLVWHQSNVNGYSDNFPTSTADQLDNVEWLLIPIITLAGADFGGWGDFAAARTIARVGRSVKQPVFVAIAVIVAAAIAADGLRISYSADGAGLTPELLIGGVITALVIYLILVCRPRQGWPARYPYLALVICVVLDTAFEYVISTRVNNDATGVRADGWDALVWLGIAAVGVIALTAARGKLPNWLMVSAIYASLIGVVYVATSLDSVATIVHPFGISADNSPWIGYEGLKGTAALITLAAVAVAVATGRLALWRRPIAMLLQLAVSLQILEWVDSLYGGAQRSSGGAKVTGQLALAAAVVLVLALSWEFAASGEEITNGHAPRFPRDSRLMLFLGYIVVAATTSVFFSNIGTREAGKWRVLESQFEAENYVRTGLLFLGGPLVITIFVVGFNRWRDQPTAEGSSSPGRARHSSTARS